ncbi:hypothetical protein M413DRAFT_440065 [Hebeloma cylindrosporum]|uniref:Protein kinase domain-containing protein n=1 Tax=Hebeloma cylindrosporum TaxID=76867 RepID=A0A0C3CHX3_HEBCY|nr:hypothetical protein M413DRAFT_440065 [Hebeloma cylindrosporum h7]
MASTPTPLPVQSTPLAASAQGSMKGTAKKFIGAVEDEWQLFSDCASDYTIGAPIGFGASSIVYAATYHPSSPAGSGMNESSKGIACALKVLDLDSLPPRSLQLLQRETTLMSLSKHPNVLRVRGSWMEGHKLYIALRLMKKGSAADVMRYGWPGGMEEDVVRCILRQALKGLNYLHINGFIHRDVKAANLLIDDDGTVLLGDLGVAADLAEDTSQIGSTSQSTKTYALTSSAAVSPPRIPSGSGNGASSKRSIAFDGSSPQTPKPKMGKRKSFVGTPCWMSPELIQGKQYDSSSDIWSFGITALELTQGRPPRSRESPQRVLLKTIQEDPPTLDREGGVYKYSRAFKEVVDSCLAKDPSKRPSAEELLQTPFFKAAKKKSYLINTILRDLPPLVQRQERRVIPPVLSANSIDSWDFATTINSPTTSVYRRRVLEDFVSAEDEALRAAGGVFEMEEDRRAISTHHSRIASWAADPEVPVINETDAEQEIHSLPSSTTSESSILSPSFASSERSTQPATSVPSSFTAPSDIIDKLETADSSSLEQANPNPTLVGLKSVLPESASTASSAPTLWHLLKNNVKRPSGRHDSFSDTNEGSPRKDKESGRMNGIFSGASKGLFSRRSSRSLAATPSLSFNDPSTEPPN